MLVQALAVSQILPSSAFALKVEAALEGSAKSGLEERLGAAAPAGLEEGRRLDEVVNLAAVPVIYPGGVAQDLSGAKAVLITADAGKGTRFAASGGGELKVIAPVGGLPAGIRSKLAARELGWPVISVVSYRKEDVMAAFGQHMPEILFVEAENPTGGTGYAIYHGAAVKGLRESDALVIATMGDQPLYDRPVLEAVEQAFRAAGADLVIATALFHDPKGKGRIVRDTQGKILGVLEQKDIEKGATLGGYSKEHLLAIPEGNLSIYAMPAKRLFDLLAETRNNNAQSQFYLPDIVKMVLDRGGRVEAVRIDPDKAPDLTTAEDLATVEATLARQGTGLEEGVSSPAGEWTAADWKKALAGAGDLLKRIGEEMGEDLIQEEVAVDPARLAPFLEGRLKEPLPSAEAVGVLSEFSDIFGWHPQQIKAQLARAARLIERFEEEHGAGAEPLYFGWAPGRWMMFGHGDYNGFDEFGGTLQAGMMVIARARNDGWVTAVSTNPEFAKGSFDAADGFQPANSWVDLVQGSVRYAQDRFPGERFRGMEILVDSDIPGRGQSSSTAVSVASMMAALSLNGKPLNPEELVVWCAEAERWGALTRGGQADQSFMLLSKRGQVMEVGPDLGRRKYFPFPATHRLVVLDSRMAPDKTGDTRISFNQQSAQTQLLGFELLKARFLARFPGQAEKILPVRNLRALYDLAVELGLEWNLRAIAKNLPKAIFSGDIAQEIRKRYRKSQKARPDLKISAPDVTALLADLYPDVPAPPGGWRIKPRIEHLFLLWDLAGRVELALDNGDMETFGAIMVEEMESLDRNYEVINKEHAGLLASYAQEAGVAGVTGQGDFGGNVLALVSSSATEDLIEYLFDKYYSRRDFKTQEALFKPPAAVLVATSSRAAGPIRPRLPHLGEFLPAKILQAVDPDALPQWVEQLSTEADPALFRLYGWLKDLPPVELQELLRRYAQMYPSMIQHFEETGQELVAGKSQARKEVTLKADRTWVSSMDQRIQESFNRLVAGDEGMPGRFPFVTVVGEEIPGPTKSVGGDPLTASWVAFRDPLDGTSNYISEDRQQNRRYLSLLRLDYRGKDGVLRPLLTVAVAPEFLKDGPVWLVAGLGIDGVLVNGEVRKASAQERPSSEAIAGINQDLLGENHPDYRLYHETAKQLGLRVLVAQDNMGLFQIPLGQMDLFLAPPQAPWDSRPAEHLVLALGGSVTTPRGRPYALDRQTLKVTLQERGEFLLFAGSAAAAELVIAAYQTEAARVEAMARLSTAQMMIQQAGNPEEAAAYQRDLLQAEQALSLLERQPPQTGTGLEELPATVPVPSVVDANRGLILAGEALTFLEIIPFIQPVDGQQVPIVAIAENEAQQKKVLNRAQALRLSVSVIDASKEYGGSVMAAALAARARLAAQGFVYRIAMLLSQLKETVGFLGVPGPESYARAADGFLREQLGDYL